MARAMTSGELTKVRADGQFLNAKLIIPVPAVILKATVTTAPTDDDEVAELAISIVSGSVSDVDPDMTCLVGTVSEGYDKGIIRIRKQPTTSVMYIGVTSEVAWSNGDHLTVIDDFQIWARHINVIDKTTYKMDWDIAYSDQHIKPDPAINCGCDAVVELVGSTVDVEFDASPSRIAIGSISSWSWSAPGSDSISGGTTNNPTITYSSTGTYRVEGTATSNQGKSFTAYRYVHIWDDASPPILDFNVENCEGEFSTGGWAFDVILYDDATKALVRDRAKVILFAEDWYQNTEESLGPLEHRENVVCVGWITAESINWDSVEAAVTFTVEGPQYWFDKAKAYPTGYEDTDFADNGGGNPSDWLEIADLTPPQVLDAFLRWRTTATRMMDTYIDSMTLQAASMEAPKGSLWAQLQTLVTSRRLWSGACDRYGRLFLEKDLATLPLADRSAIPVVMTVTDDDCSENIVVHRRVVPKYSLVELSGIYYADGEYDPIGARSPGTTPASKGEEYKVIQELTLADQADANELAGLVAGSGVGEIEGFDFELAQNNRFVDIVPKQYVEVTIVADDTVRGIAGTYKAVPRRVSLNFGASSDATDFAEMGVLLCEVEAEGVGVQWPADPMEFPNEETPAPGGSTGGTIPPIPPIPPSIAPPPVEPASDTDAVAAIALDVRTTDDLDQGSPTWTTEY